MVFLCFKLSGTTYMYKHHKDCIFVGHCSYSHQLYPLCMHALQHDHVLSAHAMQLAAYV